MRDVIEWLPELIFFIPMSYVAFDDR